MTYEELLTETALKDERFIVMTAETARWCGTCQSFRLRFIDRHYRADHGRYGRGTGIAGQDTCYPALAPFLTMRAFEFIRTDVGIANLPVKLSGFIPGFLRWQWSYSSGHRGCVHTAGIPAWKYMSG